MHQVYQKHCFLASINLKVYIKAPKHRRDYMGPCALPRQISPRQVRVTFSRNCTAGLPDLPPRRRHQERRQPWASRGSRRFPSTFRHRPQTTRCAARPCSSPVAPNDFPTQDRMGLCRPFLPPRSPALGASPRHPRHQLSGTEA